MFQLHPKKHLYQLTPTPGALTTLFLPGDSRGAPINHTSREGALYTRGLWCRQRKASANHDTPHLLWTGRLHITTQMALVTSRVCTCAEAGNLCAGECTGSALTELYGKLKRGQTPAKVIMLSKLKDNFHKRKQNCLMNNVYELMLDVCWNSW